MLGQLARSTPIQQSWAEWLRERLPEQLAPHLLSVVPKPGVGAVAELVVFTDAAAWAMRLRYALALLQEPIGARAGAPARIRVRVLMESATSGR